MDRRGFLAVSAAALAAASVPPARAGKGDALDALAEATRAQYGMPGLAIAVTRGTQTLALRAWGEADIEFGLRMTPARVQFLASSSKMFAGLATLRLAEAGKLALDDSILDALPELPAAWRSIRVRHLLDHTSGLPGLRGSAAYQAEYAKREREERLVAPDHLDRFSVAETLGYLADLPLAAPAGTRWEYGFTSYLLLGEVVRRTSGVAYERFVEREILAPCGMATARYGSSSVVVPGRRAANYTRQHGPLQNWIYPYTPSGYPAAGLNASVQDLAKFFHAIARGDLLSKQGWETLWAPTRLADGKTVDYGLGWTTQDDSGRRVVGHEGGGCCWIAYYPDQRLGVAAVCNLAGARADGFDRRIAALHLD